MWEAIRSNERRSWILIGLMGVVLVLLGFCLGLVVDPSYGGPLGAFAAVVLWLILFLVAMFQGDSLLLMSSRAHQITKADTPQYWNVVEEMTIASGLGKMPKVYIVDHDVPNAFAVGRKPESAAVAVTSGLLKRLSRDELQGVVAHEIGHIKNLDIRFMTIASVMVGAIVLLSDVFLRSLWYGSASRRSSSSRGGGQGQLIFLLIAILVAILAPICAQLLYFACSRRREYLADASAARYTRYPDGLASALEKISVLASGMKNVNRAVAPMYIVNPLRALAANSAFSTHPPTETRIKILRGMGGASYVDYEAAYKKLTGESERLIGLRSLTGEKGLGIRKPNIEKETKQGTIDRVREVASVLDRAAEMIPIICMCGVHIKVPPGLKRSDVPCPKCGRSHEIPHAERSATADTAHPHPARPHEAQPENEAQDATPLRYERKGDGWESFRCDCGKVLQISPNFIAPTITCLKL